ncbi:acyl carrier protein [Streptomyces sp. NPDC020858]|uniref:acyl carrier protein n=1 Tax=Streptomyces sp. NPDC020858 TaxID=3365097 RepID=UPI0037B6AFFF
MTPANQLITTLLTDEFGVSADRLVPSVTVRQLGLDSLSIAELAMLLEEGTGINIENLLTEHSTLEELTMALTPTPRASAVVG